MYWALLVDAEGKTVRKLKLTEDTERIEFEDKEYASHGGRTLSFPIRRVFTLSPDRAPLKPSYRIFREIAVPGRAPETTPLN
jgi:hypothetical protein